MKKYVAFILSCVNLIAWGSWPLIRMNCRADGPVFYVFYLLGQWLTCLISSLAINKYVISIYLQHHEYDPMKVLTIILGGYCAANSDFLCACASTRIPVSIAFPVYASMCLIQGIVFTYILVQGKGSNPRLLFIGILFACCAIVCLALVDAYSVPKSKVIDNDSVNKSMENLITVENPMNNSNIFELDEIEVRHAPSNDHIHFKIIDLKSILSNINPWIYVCLFAGVICSFWCPLSNYGRISPKNISDPSTA